MKAGCRNVMRGDGVKKGLRGFTLTEMATVVVVLVVIIALLLPVLGGVRAQGRAAMCASNLKQLATAYSLRAVEVKTNTATLRMPIVKSASAWPSTLLPYVNKSVKVMNCPEAVEENEKATQVVDGVVIRVMDVGVGMSVDVPLGDASAVVWRIPWNNGSGSPPNAEAFSLGTLRWDQLRNYFTQPGYEGGPQANPENFWNITPNSDGTMTIYTGKATHYVQAYQLLWWDEVQLDQQNRPLMYGGSTYTLETKLTGMVGYGMNNRVPDLDPSQGRRILMLDYKKVVADLGDSPKKSPPRVHTDSWMQYRALRHNSKMNVMFTDGTVQRMGALEVDPELAVNQKELWQPQFK